LEKDPDIVSAGRVTMKSSWFSVISVVNGSVDSALVRKSEQRQGRKIMYVVYVSECVFYVYYMFRCKKYSASVVDHGRHIDLISSYRLPIVEAPRHCGEAADRDPSLQAPACQ